MDPWTLTDLFLLSDSSIYSAVTFPPLGNSDDIVVSVSLHSLLLNSKVDAPFHRLSFDYFCTDWMAFVTILQIIFGSISLIWVLLLLLPIIESDQVTFIHVYYFQLLVQLSKTIEITFFVCTKRTNHLPKTEIRHTGNHCKRILKSATLTLANKKGCLSLSRNLVRPTLDKSLKVFLKTVNLLFLLYLIALRSHIFIWQGKVSQNLFFEL